MSAITTHTISSCWRALRRHPLQADAWFDLARAYAEGDLPLHAGYAARQALRLAPERRDALQALAPAAWQADPQLDAALGRCTPDAAAALEARCARAAAACPDDWLSWLFLARVRDVLGRGGDGALERAAALEAIPGETLHNLGRWRLAADDAPGAVAALAQLLDIRPLRCGSMMILGEALLRMNNTQAAEKAFARASSSNNPAFLLDLAGRVFRHNYWSEAIAVLHKALSLRPDSVPHLVQLANIHYDVFELDACRATLERIRALDPGNRDIDHLELGMHGRLGDAQGHLAALRRAFRERADPLSRQASTIAMVSLYDDSLKPEDVTALHRELCAPIEAARAPRSVFANPRTTDRRLRIGYVTGDLHRQHPVNLFMLPVLQRHDHERFEVHVYHTGTIHDIYTAQAKACADRWCAAEDLDDPALAEAIGADGVDILVDLAGHTSTHRLGVFAMRAAPVQATFLGYPHSTGLTTIDWLIGDAVVSPAPHGHLFTEAVAQLPGSVFCWSPVDSYPLPAARAPDAPFVFGSFNNVLKLSPSTIALWARILHAVPDAQLLLKSPSLKDAAVQARFTSLFARHGVGSERLAFRGPTGLDAMMQEYGDVDAALDPTPYNGGTTTLQALWMGVPVLTLEGGNFVSRMGASFLRALDQPQWVARDADAYVAAAVALARERAAVRAGRASLRARMQASPVADIDGYVTHFEAALEAIWRSHCAGDGRRLLPAAEVAQAVRTMAGVR